MDIDPAAIPTVIEHLRRELARVRVLVVLDGRAHTPRSASFGAGDPDDGWFGLSEFMRSITSHAPGAPRVEATKAHRDTDARNAADLVNFRFDQHDLAQWDVILLFGVATEGDTAAVMTGDELAALAAFMDAGGGVFATGDHEDLGVALNGRVPRVRSMRKWYYPDPGPLGEPAAPPGLGSDRIETTQPTGPGTAVLFDNQSDDVPQPLELRYYTQQSLVFWQETFPHPLLCGRHGPLTVMPDHMHEGEVIEPWDVDATLTFSGKDFVEYPAGPGGDRPLPEIVAWGRTVAETNITQPHHLSDPVHIATARRFGVVGAYDGHRAGVGRVAVDSTWHHFFDINLIGDPAVDVTNPKHEGFNATTDGQRTLEDIRGYFRNLVTWLAPPGVLARMFAGTAWWALHRQPLAMLVHAGHWDSQRDLMSIGAHALRTILGEVPPCAVISSLLPYIVDGPAKVVPPDPWAGPRPQERPFIDTTLYLRAALGGAVVALRIDRERLLDVEPGEAAAIAVDAVGRGVARGVAGLGDELAGLAKGLALVAREMQSAGR